MLTSYPAPVEGWYDADAERAMEYALSVVVAVRKMRSDYGLNKQKPHLYVVVTDGGGSLSDVPLRQICCSPSNCVATALLPSRRSISPKAA